MGMDGSSGLVGCTYALVDVIPDAIRNGVVSTARLSIFVLQSSYIRYLCRGAVLAYSSKAKAEMKTVPRNT